MDDSSGSSIRNKDNAREAVEVELSVAPVVMARWVCSGCGAETRTHGLDPVAARAVQALASGGRVEATCRDCSQPMALRQREKSLIVMPSSGPNRHQRRARVATNRKGVV